MDYHLRKVSDPPLYYSNRQGTDIQWAASKDMASALDYFEAFRYAQWLAMRGHIIAWEERNPVMPSLNHGDDV